MDIDIKKIETCIVNEKLNIDVSKQLVSEIKTVIEKRKILYEEYITYFDKQIKYLNDKITSERINNLNDYPKCPECGERVTPHNYSDCYEDPNDSHSCFYKLESIYGRGIRIKIKEIEKEKEQAEILKKKEIKERKIKNRKEKLKINKKYAFEILESLTIKIPNIKNMWWLVPSMEQQLIKNLKISKADAKILVKDWMEF